MMQAWTSLVFHQPGKTEKSAYTAARAGAAYGPYVLGGKDTFQHVAVFTGADDGNDTQMPCDGNEREQLVVPQAEDQAFPSGMYGVHFFPIFFLDAERCADRGVQVDEEKGGKGWEDA